MSYLALYRKFRPDSFDEVKGQEHVVTTLKNQLASGRVGHAYLLRGTRGTGKTTIARLIANILYNLKYIKENKLVEVSVKDLVAEYVGQTAPKTMSVIEKAMKLAEEL